MITTQLAIRNTLGETFVIGDRVAIMAEIEAGRLTFIIGDIKDIGRNTLALTAGEDEYYFENKKIREVAKYGMLI